MKSYLSQIKLWLSVFFADLILRNLRFNLYKKPNLPIYKSKNKKVFCILEQGNSSNNNLTKLRKEIFNTKFSDVKRLNWANNKLDELADYYTENMCWSEGRSFLYKQVKGQYNYYIFIDDDIDISLSNSSNKNIAYELKNELLKNNPIHGSIPNNAWLNFESNDYGDIFPMKGGDLCVQIFRDDFADLMFPTWTHGSGKSMWYAQFIAHILFPNQSVYLNKFRANNTIHDPHMDRNLLTYSTPDKVTENFSRKISNLFLRNLFKKWQQYSLSNYFLAFSRYYLFEIKEDIFKGFIKNYEK